jgi:heat shock protein HslJ
MSTLKKFTIGLVFLTFASCSSTKIVDTESLLAENKWLLSSLMGKGLDMSQFTGGVPTVDFFEKDKLSGSTGCNSFSGKYLLEGKSMKYTPGAMTRKMCPGTGEQDFLSALRRVGKLKISMDKLTLLDGSTELMSFVPMNE